MEFTNESGNWSANSTKKALHNYYAVSNGLSILNSSPFCFLVRAMGIILKIDKNLICKRGNNKEQQVKQFTMDKQFCGETICPLLASKCFFCKVKLKSSNFVRIKVR